MPLTNLEEEATLVEAQIPPGFRVGVIGSASFWHEESEQICSDIGERLAGLNSLVLLTGGVPGVGECIGRAL